MNYQLVIKRTLQLQSKIVKACGRNFGSLKSFNSKYSLSAIDYVAQIATFYTKSTDELNYINFNFVLIRTEGKRINHTVEVTLI